MSSVVLALWIALIGADRIDLAGGHGPFIVTPFLALTPVVVASELWRRAARHRPLTLSRYALGYAMCAAGLICVTMVSVFRAREMPVSAARTFLLIGDVTGTFVVAVLCADRPDLTRTLAKGALACLVLYGVFDVAEVLWYVGRAPELIRIGPMTARFDALQNAGPLPRLAGPVADGNRGGFVVLFYIVVIGAAAELSASTRRIGVGFAVLFLVLTLSRSAAMGAMATLAMAMISRRRRVSARLLVLGALAVAVAATYLLVRPRTFDQIEAILSSPVASRLSVTEGSAQSHLELIKRGIDEGMQSVPRAAFGLGYGNSYLVLQDIFPGNRYGNFHSLYVTMFAEGGIFALILTLLLMGVPLVTGGPWRALIAGSFAFNVFYQTTTEPVFWFLLALAWLTIPRAASRPGLTAAVEHGTRH